MGKGLKLKQQISKYSGEEDLSYVNIYTHK